MPALSPSHHPVNPHMWIARLALRKPYTFTVMAILILILGAVSFLNLPKDIFPA